MQSVRVSDAVRCLLFNLPKEPNLVCSKESIYGTRTLGNTAIWRDALAQRQNRITLVSWDGMRLSGLASARTRRGHRVWEVDRLYVPGDALDVWANGNGPHDGRDTVFLKLLDELVQAAGFRQGERILTRIPSNSPIIYLAQHAGFFPLFEESLLEGPVRGTKTNGTTPSPAVVERSSQDEYALFQLFCAATPQRVRTGLGITFDQWHDAQEPRCPGEQELVTRHEEKVTGWLEINSHRGVEEGNILSHPEYPDSLPLLVQHAMTRQGLHRWLVPNYLEMEKASLLRHGLKEVARYTVVIKTVAVPVLRHGMAPVEA